VRRLLPLLALLAAPSLQAEVLSLKPKGFISCGPDTTYVLTPANSKVIVEFDGDLSQPLVHYPLTAKANVRIQAPGGHQATLFFYGTTKESGRRLTYFGEARRDEYEECDLGECVSKPWNDILTLLVTRAASGAVRKAKGTLSGNYSGPGLENCVHSLTISK
jgi:hypothetical protein